MKDVDIMNLISKRADTNLPCRHSGIRPQHDPSVKLDCNDGCLQTEVVNQYLYRWFIPQVRFPHMAQDPESQRHGISLRCVKNTKRSRTYSGFHLLGQPLWPHFFQHGALQTHSDTHNNRIRLSGT